MTMILIAHCLCTILYVSTTGCQFSWSSRGSWTCRSSWKPEISSKNQGLVSHTHTKTRGENYDLVVGCRSLAHKYVTLASELVLNGLILLSCYCKCPLMLRQYIIFQLN